MWCLYTIFIIANFVYLSHQQSCSIQSNSDVNLPNLDTSFGQPLSNCCNICQNTPGCQSFAWNNYMGGACWLKAGTGPIISNNGVSVGILSNTCSSLANQDINLPNLAVSSGQPFGNCCNICRNTAGCQAFAWNDYMGGTCWLKAGTGPLIANNGVGVGIVSNQVVNGGKKVFAHYMVGFAFPSDQTYFDTQIKKAIAAGIDGFALNVGIDSWQPDRVSKALAAAKNNGNFVMFISFDMSSLTFNNTLLSTFSFAASQPNYFKVNGKPVFSTFGGENQDAFWSTWKSSSGLNPYFCPSWPNYPTLNLLQSHPVADCIFTWNAWPAGNSGPSATFDTTGDKNLLASARATGKTYMAPLSPWFYTHVWGTGFNKNWIYSSEILLPQRWQQIVALQPDFVEIITWNDYSESSYVCSIGSDLPTSLNGITNMITTPQAMNHDAWLQLSAYYITWYKNNARPIITTDQFYWWYRIHPKNNVVGDVPQYRNDANDCVVIHTIVKNVNPQGGKYTMIIDLNKTVTSYVITQLEQTACIPFPATPGYVTISLKGPDGNIWWAEGNNCPQQASGDNFNAFSNSHSFPSP